MADFIQELTTLLSHQELINAATAAGTSVVGTEKDVRTYLSASIYTYHAIVEALSNNPAVLYIVQGRASTGASIDEDWLDLHVFATNTAAAVAVQITGTEAIGETTIALDDNPVSNFAQGDMIYVHDTGTVNQGEWGRVAFAATGPDILTLVDGLTRAKDASDTIWSAAQLFFAEISLAGVSYIRMIVVGQDDVSGADIHFKVEMVAATDIT